MNESVLGGFTVNIAVIMFTIGMLVGGAVKQKAMDTAIIEHGCAYYAPDTGEFTWMKQ